MPRTLPCTTVATHVFGELYVAGKFVPIPHDSMLLKWVFHKTHGGIVSGPEAARITVLAVQGDAQHLTFHRLHDIV